MTFDVRVGAASLAARVAGAVSRRLGRGGGTALPGLVAERIAPHILATLAAQLPLGSVVVTGTNGKTTTSRMLAGILSAAGLSPLRNASGSNLARGLATTLASRTSLLGTLSATPQTIGLFETDEAAFAQAVPAVRPKLIVVTNLFRDQLDRYGEVDSVAALWRGALKQLGMEQRSKQTTLVLNADDPSVAALAGKEVFEGNSSVGERQSNVFFGLEDVRLGKPGLEHAADAKTCPVCGALLVYPICFYGHIGHYQCANGHRRPAPVVLARRVESHGFAGSTIALETPAGSATIHLPVAGLHNVYNALAASTAGHALGVKLEHIVQGLERFTAAFGRLERVEAGGRTLYLILAKNPVGMNETLRTLFADGAPKHLLMALNDLDADGRDVSWIWDADFERVAGHAASLVISGRRAEDLALRLKYAGALDGLQPAIEPGITAALDRALAGSPKRETLYAVLTYTAMLELRRVLTERGHIAAYWDEERN